MMATESLRARTRRAVHSEITAVAMRLFAEQGFESTTIDQIAAAAGISRRSFFHYFGSKEDVVTGDMDALGEQVRQTLEAQPAQIAPWPALRAAFLELRTDGANPDRVLLEAQLYHDTPSLRAKHLEKHLRWRALLAPDIQRRLGLPATETPDPRAQAVVAAAIACLESTIEAWRASGGQADPEHLFDEAMAAIRG